MAHQDKQIVYSATDTSLPLVGNFQAVSATLIYHKHYVWHVAGKVTALDAELQYMSSIWLYQLLQWSLRLGKLLCL